MYATGLVFELIIWGFATWVICDSFGSAGVDLRFWLLFSALAFLADLRKARYNLNMWSGAFPIGAYGLCANQIAISLNSPAFRVVSSLMLVILVVYWLASLALTIPLVLSGELFLADAHQKMVKDREGKGRQGKRVDDTSASRPSDAMVV